MFTHGFKKIAKAKYDEHAEYTQANEVDRVLSKHPHPDHMKPLKAGARVAYYSDNRGWKEGPWAHHMKGGCSVDEANEKPKKAYEKKVREEVTKNGKNKDMAWRIISDRVEKAFPRHHTGDDWAKEAIGLGDLGTVIKVDKSGGLPEYHITWDKHPDCTWGTYRSKDLKIAPGGM